MSDDVNSVRKMTRCPFCGALNAVEADWCGQCLARFTEPGVVYGPLPGEEAGDNQVDELDEVGGDPPHDRGATKTQVERTYGSEDDGATTTAVGLLSPPEPEVQAAPDEPSPEAKAASEDAPVLSERGAFAVTADGVLWTCARCETVNPLDEMTCVACGAPFAETVKPAQEREPRDPGTAAMFSLFFPGAGHAWLGLWGEAITRGILSLWAIAVTFFALVQGSGGSSVLLSALFGMTAFALWIVGAHDAYWSASLDTARVLLKGRRYTWVVAGLLLLLVVGLTMSGFSARK